MPDRILKPETRDRLLLAMAKSLSDIEFSVFTPPGVERVRDTELRRAWRKGCKETAARDS